MNRLLFFICLGGWIIYTSWWVLSAILTRNDDPDNAKFKADSEEIMATMGANNYHKRLNGLLILFLILDNLLFLLCLTQVGIFENAAVIHHTIVTTLLLNLLSDGYLSVSLKLRIRRDDFTPRRFRALIFKIGLKILTIITAVYVFALAL